MKSSKAPTAALLLALFFPCALRAQDGLAERTTTAMKAFVEAYNGQSLDDLYGMFAPVLKDALPREEADRYFRSVYSAYGAISSFSNIGSESSFVLFKSQFRDLPLLVKLSIDGEARLNGLSIEEYVEELVPERSASALGLPFTGTWFVFWGGDTKEENYHVVDRGQKAAVDFVVLDGQGKSHKGEGRSNEDYYAYGRPVISPCDGSIVMVVDGVMDNAPGRMNPYYAPGNSVMIRTDAGEYILLGHMIPHSIVVREGQRIQRGGPIGLCGNSGNSSEAHIHMHMQNGEDLGRSTGIKMFFAGVTIDGKREEAETMRRGAYVGNE